MLSTTTASLAADFGLFHYVMNLKFEPYDIPEQN